MIASASAAKVELVPLVKKKSNMEKTQSIIQAADCIFVSGGDVKVEIRVFTERSVVQLIKKSIRKEPRSSGFQPGVSYPQNIGSTRRQNRPNNRSGRNQLNINIT